MPTNQILLENKRNLLFLSVSGSRLYGTHHEDSDYDFKGMCLGGKEDYIGSMRYNFEQYETFDVYKPFLNPYLRSYKYLTHEESPDMVIYEFRKFVKLLEDNNPNILELFGNIPKEYIIETSPEYEMMKENLDKFLCKSVKYRYSGHAYSQFKRIESHRKWLLDPPKGKPSREDFHLPVEKRNSYQRVLSEVRKYIDKIDLSSLDISKELQWEISEYIQQRIGWNVFTQKNKERFFDGVLFDLGVDDDYILYFHREAEYENAVRKWKSYCKWKKTRNPERAKLEAKCNYDSKHGMHLIRLMRMGIEILRGEGINTMRDDAEELKEIRFGNWTYEQLEEEFRCLDSQIENDLNDSKLPRKPNHKWINDFTVKTIESQLF